MSISPSVQRYSGLKDLLYVHMRKDDNILMVGAGNSRLSEDMYDDGFTSLTNIDASRVCIDQVSTAIGTITLSIAIFLTWQDALSIRRVVHL
jgi:2-polyprenyl-3-methyl-5-hydroxy-6-metoxy-1,4-benzoquinol methylase